MAWEKVATLSALQSEGRMSISIQSKKILLILNENKAYAVQAHCPHLKLPLKKAEITVKNELICPFHKSTFDLDSGTVVSWSPWPPVVGPLLGKASCPKSLRVYKTQLEGNDILVDIETKN